MSTRLFDLKAVSRPAHPIWVLLFMILLGFGSINTAQATHFRYGSISWQPVASDPTGKTIQFKVSVAYRTSYGYNNPVVLGGTIQEVGFNFGDGTSVRPDFVVTSINASEDWFFGEVTLTHVYASTGDKTAYFTDCCRISTLQNNHDEYYYLPTTVNVGTANRSPVATIIPILNVPSGSAAATALVPASDPDGDPLTYTLATSAELGGITFAQPTGIAVNSTTGQITFNTVGKTNGEFYNTVIKVSDGKTATFVDLLIRIGGSGNPPTFVYTSNATPANGSVISVTISQPISFSVTAVDSDPGSITLNAAGLPVGSTTTPALQTAGNPVFTVFTWTPTALGTFVLVFTATDPTANQASTSVTIQVGNTTTPPPPPPPTPTGCGSPTATIGQPFQVLAPTYNCNGNGAITFNVTGGNGSPIEYQCIPGVSVGGVGGWNSSCNQFVDAEIRSASDAPIMPLQARQNGVVYTFNWNLRAQCPVSRPPGSTTANQSPGVVVPIPNQSGTQGQAFSYTFPVNTFVDPDGDPMTYAAIGLPAGLSLSGRTISGTPTNSGVSSVTITATDGSILSTFSAFLLTINPTGVVMPPSGFAITGVTGFGCVAVTSTRRDLTFTPQYSGSNGQPITFSVVNEKSPTTAPGPYMLTMYIDNPVITLQAVQSGVTASFAYNWRAACLAIGARVGAEPTARLAVSVFGNPVSADMAEFEVRGAEGESVRMQILDSRGYSISETTVSQAGTVERASLRLGRSAGMYFLRVSTAGQHQVVKVVKQ